MLKFLDSMEDKLGFEPLKISAFSKLKYIQHYVKEVTIGPASVKKAEVKNVLPKTKTETDSPRKAPPQEEPVDIIDERMRMENLQRQEEIKSRIQEHVNVFEEFSRGQEESRKSQWLKIQQCFIEDIQQKETFILNTMIEYNKATSNEHAKLLKHYQDLADRRKVREEELHERERQRRILQANIETIKNHQQDFRLIYQQIIPVLKKCSNNDELKTILGEESKLLKVLPEKFEEITIKCKTGKVGEDEVQQCSHMLTQLSNLKTKIEEIVEKINSPKEAPKEQPVVVQPIPEPPVPPTFESKPQTVEKGPEISEALITITRYVSLTNLKMFTDIMNFLEKHTETFRDLEHDPLLKQFRFDCKKAVNIPVNSLSSVNSEHMLDKYTRLHNLLKGKDVIVSDKVVTASRHPQGVSFCMDLLAKKFVLQGDLMVSSNPESAFCYATVMASLWNDFPDFGHLLLAYFYRACPYLVPYYVPRQVGESDEEFYQRRGYQYNEGQIEKQDKFLKRMTGMMRLYSALLIVKAKRDHNKTPHNIENGWRWLSSLLKLEPQVDITATMLHTFLETVGFEMEAKYGMMFQKLIRIIIEKFLPMCRVKCTGGSTTRLELLLTEYFKKRRFDPPNGYLAYSHW